MGLLDGLVMGLARKSKFGRSHSLRPLTSKRANRRFYKGNGCRNEGVHAKRGRYVVDSDKLLTLEVPDLTGFKVRSILCSATRNREDWTPSLSDSRSPLFDSCLEQLKPYVSPLTPSRPPAAQ